MKNRDIITGLTVLAVLLVLRKFFHVDNLAILVLLAGSSTLFEETEVKSLLIVVASLFFLRQYMLVASSQIIVLVAGVSFFYAMVVSAERFDATRRTKIGTAIVIVLFIFFLLHKIAQLHPHTGLFDWWLNIVGLSYLALKLISFAVLELSTPFQKKSYFTFLSYCFYAPTFVAGPILEFQEFHQELANQLSFENRLAMFLEGMKRSILGIFKIKVLSRFTSGYAFYSISDQTLLSSPPSHLLCFAYLTMLDLYFNFSGYTDLAIGISNSLGLSIPENFHYPFVAGNLQEFWKRWHISLSNWLKKYVFLPLYKVLLEMKFVPEPLSAPMAILLTFSLMGVWHGLRPNYIAYGLIHGIGLFAFMLWSRYLKTRKFYASYSSNRSFAFLSWFLTIHYFVFSLVVFFADTDRKWDVLLKVLNRAIPHV